MIAAGAGILQQSDPSAFCNIILTKNWAKYFLNKIGFVKQKLLLSSNMILSILKRGKNSF